MRRLLIEHGFAETRLALVEAERLVEVRLAREEEGWRAGSLHLGRVVAVDPVLEAAFVDIGAGKPGLLPLRDAGKAAAPGAGDAILVQVTRAPVEEKGVRLSARPVLPGRGLALRPTHAGIAFAAGLEDPSERERIRQAVRADLPAGLGLRVRRGAAGLSEEALRAETRRLAADWSALSALAQRRRAPAVLSEGPDAVELAVLDWAAPGMEIVCNDRALAASLGRRIAERVGGLDIAPRLDAVPALFEAEGVEEQIEAALRPEAPLADGAVLLVEPVRTLTAIDVNSGASPRRPREINLAAAAEIAHQLRLRAIGGLVVIDFIDLRSPRARAPVLEALAEALSQDPAGCELAGATRLGLVELTRRRTGPSLLETLTQPCGIGGGGRVRRIETVAGAALRSIAAEALAAPGRRMVLACAPELAEALAGAMAAGRAELERRLGRSLEIRPDVTLPRETYHVVAEPAGVG